MPKYQRHSAALLAFLCLLVGGTWLLPSESSLLAHTAGPVSLHNSAEIHHWELVQRDVAVARVRNVIVAQPVWLSATVVSSVGSAVLLLMLVLRRGSVLSRAPDNVGWQRLLYLGINRR